MRVKKLWCVKTSMSVDGEIYLDGSAALVLPNGSLVVYDDEEEAAVTMAFAPDAWQTVHDMDGERDKPRSIKIWRGEV
ncbi:hypothetical protein [Methylobacterium brachythecii]|uniref:Uncharacterized protein n=1 Tax=Methylobacterium brachythecii TaxID=1176177 RepID=A0A7W6AQX7_9HYPH|nr:hypothetical protein [Methylobacterium brachythecii]MBB3904232.1 hypothetical protein [Methylobacterium brachythecii]GLS45106.1 hypothetical protein GCM10007884_30950 [Methylobacterium brachythecii]